MARKVQVLLVDDLDGSDLGTNGETVAFGMGGERYEIDLSKPNAEKFRTMIGEYVEHARNVTRQGGGSRRASSGSMRSASDRAETKQARAWLIQAGFLTPESRGRISSENWERYRNRGQMKLGEGAALAEAAPSLAETKGEVPAKKTAAASQRNSTTAAKATAGVKTPEKASA